MINKLKKHKESLTIIGVFIGLILIISMLNVFFLSKNVTKYLLLIITFSLTFILGYKSGKKRNNKGYIAGIKTSIILITSLIIIDLLIIRYSFDISRIIYYLLLILICILASILGINKKAN